MRIDEVVGRVMLARIHSSLRGGRFLVALPMPLEALREHSPARGEELVVYDNLGAGPGALIASVRAARPPTPLARTRLQSMPSAPA